MGRIKTISSKTSNYSENEYKNNEPVLPSSTLTVSGYNEDESSRISTGRSKNSTKLNRTRRKLIISSILCVIFMLTGYVGSSRSNSLLIETGAIYLLIDLSAFMIALFGLWSQSRSSSEKLSFGWNRVEITVLLISILIIWVATGLLMYVAALRLMFNEFEIHSQPMLIASGLSIMVIIVMGSILHPEQNIDLIDVEGGPDKSTRHTYLHAAFHYVLSNFIQSLGIFFVSVFISFNPKWSILDPICTLCFSVLVLATTITILKDALLVVVESTPKFLDYIDVMETFLHIPGVVRVNNLQIWPLAINKIALAAHLVVDQNANPEKVLLQANTDVHKKYDLFETTIHYEETSSSQQQQQEELLVENLTMYEGKFII